MEIKEPLRGSRAPIGSTTPAQEIISALVSRGCPDLTPSIDPALCSTYPLAGGGFCDVYGGVISGDTDIAIKCLRCYDTPGGGDDSKKLLKRAAKELYHWSRLSHPNVLALMGLAMFNGRLSMISKWMKKGSLMAYIRTHEHADRLKFCVDVCAGLHYIHAERTVHGDLKAANVLVSDDDTAVIADFGNSQLRELTLKFTATTSFSLSCRWAAPELLDDECGSAPSKESDVYAYGMTVLEILTGKVPFEEFSEHRVMTMVALKHKTPARPEVGVSDGVWGIMQDCWSWEQTERPDIVNIKQRLEDLVSHPSPSNETKSSSNLNPVSPIHSSGKNSLREADTSVIQMDVEDEDYPEKLRTMADLTRRYYLQGRVVDAELPQTEILGIHTREFGESDSRTLRSMQDLAAVYYDQGRRAEAEQLELKVLAIQKRDLGAEHPRTLQSMTNFAMAYYREGRLVDAETLWLEVLASRRRTLGSNHPETLWGMANLAATYFRQDRLAEARVLEAEVIDIRARTLGEDHPDTLLGMASLAATYYKEGRMQDAKILQDQVLAARKQALGDYHPDTLQSKVDMAMTYYTQGELVEAELLEAEVVAARKQLIGHNHPDTLQSMANLATTYYRQGRLADAESLRLEVLNARTQVLGNDHLDTVQSKADIAAIYYKQGRLEIAEKLRAEVLAVHMRDKGDDHADTLKSMANLAAVYAKQGRLADAESLLTEVVASQKQVMGKDHPSTLYSMQQLATTYYTQGHLSKAESLYIAIVGARRRVFGDKHSDTLRAMRHLALIYQARSEEDQCKARALIARVEAINGKL